MEHLENLVEAIRNYDGEAAASWAQKAMDEGVDPIAGLDAVSGVMKNIGDLFEQEELWLPDLIGSADAAQAALTVIEKKITESGKEPERLGTVVLGTVFGDIHTIGKTMVGALRCRWSRRAWWPRACSVLSLPGPSSSSPSP